MILKWDRFNEAKAKLNSYTITKELIEDYFQPIMDMGIIPIIEYCVRSNFDDDWYKSSTYEQGYNPITRVSYQVIIENNVQNMDIRKFEKYQKFINELFSISRRIDSNYNVDTTITSSDDHECIIIYYEYKPTLRDACLISYDMLKDYLNEYDMTLFKYIDSCSFNPSDSDCFIEITLNGKDSSLNWDVKEFKKRFDEWIEENFSKSSYTIEGSGNKYIIKNFVSLEDIGFKY